MVSDQKVIAGFDLDRTIEALHEEARQRTGLADFGPAGYLKPFRMLSEHVGSPALSDIGREWYRRELANALVGRLVREDEWKKHPGYKHRGIDEPLVICGIPRTGTTALHKLLSVDSQFQGLDNWLTSWPKPRPPRETWENERGFREAVANLDHMFTLIPQMRVAHEMVADEVDECLEVLRLDFVSNRFPSSFIIPEYDAWFQDQDETPCYRRLADTLRLIGLNDDRTWLLKNPGHFAEMEALLDTFPDARVVITHRDPVKSIPSLGSVLSGMYGLCYTTPELTRIGPRELAYWSKAREKTDAVRRRRPAEQFLDIDHRDFHADPIAIVRHIYTHFGIDLADDTVAAMKEWLAANPAGKHGAHNYRIEDYGVTEQEIRARLGDG